MNVPNSLRLPLALFIGQAFANSIATLASYTAANTLFLVDYDAKLLPYVFVIGAVLSLGIAYSLVDLRRGQSDVPVALGVAFCFVVLYFVMWLGLTFAVAPWLSFAVMVLHLMFSSLGNMANGVLANRVFTVREMKRWWPIIVASQAIAAVCASLLIPSIMRQLGSTQNVLLITIGAMLVFWLLAMTTAKRFVEPKAPQAHTAAKKASKSLLQLLKNPYVARLLLYSACGSMLDKLVDFLVSSQAQMQFSTPEGLATFFSSFRGATQFATFIFSLLLTGLLLNKFGLRFGLTSRPTFNAILLVLAIISGLLFGPATPFFFWSVVAVRFIDQTTESISKTSVRAAKQAVSDDERVEGVAGPISVLVTGILLILFNVLSSNTQLYVVAFTLVVALSWALIGLGIYRGYRQTLVQALTRRTLYEAELTLADPASLVVVEQFLHSPDLRKVRVALDLLEHTRHPSLLAYLSDMVSHTSVEGQIEVLGRIDRLRISAALPAVEACLQANSSPLVTGAALRALCALLEAEAVGRVIPYLADSGPEIQRGAMVGLLRNGGIAGILAAAEPFMRLIKSRSPAQRMAAAQVIGEVGANSFYEPLLKLMGDDSLAVRQTALLAAQQVTHPRLLPCLIENLSEGATRSAAMAALIASGERLFPLVAAALAGDAPYAVATVRRLVRVCGQIKCVGAAAVLQRHLDHPDPELQKQVLLALHQCGFRAGAEQEPQINGAVRGCIRQGVRLLLAQRTIGEEAATAPLRMALLEEFRGIRQRVLLLLALIYEPRVFMRIDERLTRGNSRAQSLALETLDITLSNEQKALVLPLLDTSLSLAQRIATLNQHFSLPDLGRAARLTEICTDATAWPQGWTRACAIYAAGKLGLRELVAAIEGAAMTEEEPVRETAHWALATLSREGD
jgi:ATP:ADP antiporter, AAA family